MGKEKRPLALDYSTFMLCTLGGQEGDVFLMQIPILSRKQLIEANQAAIENGWEQYVEQEFLEEILVEGNKHPVVTALLHAPSQLVACKVLVSAEESIWLTMSQNDFEELDMVEIPNTVH